MNKVEQESKGCEEADGKEKEMFPSQKRTEKKERRRWKTQ